MIFLRRGRKNCPRTPDKMQTCSRRHWDAQIKSWKKKVHKWAEWYTEKNKRMKSASIVSIQKPLFPNRTRKSKPSHPPPLSVDETDLTTWPVLSSNSPNLSAINGGNGETSGKTFSDVLQDKSVNKECASLCKSKTIKRDCSSSYNLYVKGSDDIEKQISELDVSRPEGKENLTCPDRQITSDSSSKISNGVGYRQESDANETDTNNNDKQMGTLDLEICGEQLGWTADSDLENCGKKLAFRNGSKPFDDEDSQFVSGGSACLSVDSDICSQNGTMSTTCVTMVSQG